MSRNKEMKPLHCKWVFKTKMDAQGQVERFKARLVACGNEQRYGQDYFQTFAPVMELSAVKVILVLAQLWGVDARHGDIPNAYVKAEKEEELTIHMELPTIMKNNKDLYGLKEAPDEPVLSLIKGLYGLKQSGRL